MRDIGHHLHEKCICETPGFCFRYRKIWPPPRWVRDPASGVMDDCRLAMGMGLIFRPTPSNHHYFSMFFTIL